MNPVQQKISCVYVTGVTDEPSNKRQHQTFRVAATRELSSNAVSDGISSAKATEKIDGTCCLVTEFEGQPWLWARHDRKPSKVGEKRFALHKKSRSNLNKQQIKEIEKSFAWDPAKDFKEVPEHWVPALGLKIQDGIALPDDIGHTPGWVPVQRHQRHHCWHLEAVDLVSGTALVLGSTNQSPHSEDLLIESVALSRLIGQTCELIGTNINGNPYGLGSKKNPFHVLVPHGALTLSCPDPSDYDKIWNWMTSDTEPNQVEGVVWHCHNGQLYKLHRHHLNLKWPDQLPLLCQRKVRIQVDSPRHEPVEEKDAHSKARTGNLFDKLSSFHNQSFLSLAAVCDAMANLE